MTEERVLADLQDRLFRNFQDLHTAKSQSLGEGKVFALEHGLTREEVEQLVDAIHIASARSRPQEAHWLGWIVYAAELGYDYEGDEYWQTFESTTPGWSVHGDRNWIRTQFKHFADTLHGVRPAGPWAENRGIIAWPITHAILPTDLQIALAHILYDLRGSFSAELLRNHRGLGERISERRWTGGARFQQFAEDPNLVGSIAAALVLDPSQLGGQVIERQALERITRDIERQQKSRLWLHSARSSAGRFDLKGLKSGGGRTARQTIDYASPESWRRTASDLALEPRLLVHSGDGFMWDVLMELPCLAPLQVEFPELAPILRESRPTVCGAARQGPLARGRILYEGQTVRLDTWPKGEVPLIGFETRHSQLDFLLRVDCLMRPGPVWVFRKGGDGKWQEIRSRVVHPGGSYLLLALPGEIVDDEGLERVDVSVEGIEALRLDLPAAIGSRDQRRLEGLGLSLGGTLRVVPVGVPPAFWDGEGHAEYLLGQPILLRIGADHPAHDVIVSDAGSFRDSMSLGNLGPGEVAYLSEDQAAKGLKVLQFSYRPGALAPVHTGVLEIVVREPRTWGPRGRNLPLIQCTIEPIHPSLEALWDGRVSVGLSGPSGRRVACRVELFSKGSSEPLKEVRLGEMPLPSTSDAWGKFLWSKFLGASQFQSLRERAQKCIMTLSCEELGEVSVAFNRELTAVRWSPGKRKGGWTVDLIDDSWPTRPPVVQYFGFARPDLGEPRLFELASQRLDVPAEGGMFVALHGDLPRGLVFPPVAVGLKDLRPRCSFKPRQKSPHEVLELLRVHSLWEGSAAFGGGLAVPLRMYICDGLLSEVFSLICGPKWRVAEKSYLDSTSPNRGQTLAAAVSEQPHLRTLVACLRKYRADQSTETPHQRVAILAGWFAKFLGHDYFPRQGPAGATVPVSGQREWLAEYALRLATNAGTLRVWAGPHLVSGVEALIRLPIVARAARAYSVCINEGREQDEPESGWRPQSWEWS